MGARNIFRKKSHLDPPTGIKQARKDYSCGQSARAEINTKCQPTNNMYVQCYSVLVILDVFLIPCWEGVVRVKIYFSAKEALSQYLSVDTKFMPNEQRLEVISVLVFFGHIFNPLLRGCGWSQNFFLSKRCTITIPISWYQIYVKQTKNSRVIHVLVIFGCVFNPLLRGHGLGENLFFRKRCTIVMPIS